jgi:hypothetical protein
MRASTAGSISYSISVRVLVPLCEGEITLWSAPSAAKTDLNLDLTFSIAVDGIDVIANRRPGAGDHDDTDAEYIATPSGHPTPEAAIEFIKQMIDSPSTTR